MFHLQVVINTRTLKMKQLVGSSLLFYFMLWFKCVLLQRYTCLHWHHWGHTRPSMSLEFSLLNAWAYGALAVVKDHLFLSDLLNRSEHIQLLNKAAFSSWSCLCSAPSSPCGCLCVVQRWIQHRGSARLPGVARVHGPEPGSGSPTVSLELQAAWRGSEDRPHDGGIRPEILSL